MNTLDRIIAVVKRELRLFWRDLCSLYDAIIRWIRDRFTDDLVIVDTASEPTRETAERAMQAALESNAIMLRAMMRDATAICHWSDEVMKARRRLPTPPDLARALPFDSWLRGLTVHEISALKAAGALAIMHHVYGEPENRIAGVRPVQELEESTLVFPKPPLPTVHDMFDRLSGGPRIRRIR